MSKKKMKIFFMISFISQFISLMIMDNENNLLLANQNYEKEFKNIADVRTSLSRSSDNNLITYEKFANEIQKKWETVNKEQYGNLMLEICKPISSGEFKDDRRFEVAKNYALSVLKDANEIPVELEMELTGHVVTLLYSSGAPKGEEFAKQRKIDAEVRFHAWKRMIESIDPNWNPNEVILSPNAVGSDLGILYSGMDPEAVKDPNLRAKYKAALRENQQKIERYSKQHQLTLRLKGYTKRTEDYIVSLYSHQPYNNEELKRYLDAYLKDQTTKDRIMTAVKANIEKAEKEKLK